ncbi:P-loop containing nucleoside triphosphate hydrolase protein [Aspergillus spectabilis]
MADDKPEDEALHQLQEQQSKLLETLDSLCHLGVGSLPEPPKLVVCGTRSSGKSSVLEAISRIRFPIDDGGCTTFATEIIFRRQSEPNSKVWIEAGPSRGDKGERERVQASTDGVLSIGEALPTFIKSAKEFIAARRVDESGFSDDILKVEISGPDQPNLTLVDLPGLYDYSGQDEKREGAKLIRKLTKNYMKNPRSIILAIMSATAPFISQDVMTLARRYDPERERTMVIFTQPDIVEAYSEEETTCIDLVKNERFRLELGWHVLRNRSYMMRHVDDEVRDSLEICALNHGGWQGLPQESVGIYSLRRILSGILFDDLRNSLPRLVATIQGQISERETRLAKLGTPRATLTQQEEFLKGISTDFERITLQAVIGMNSDRLFAGMGDTDGRKLRAAISQLNELFAEAMKLRGCRCTIFGRFEGFPSYPTASQRIRNMYLLGWQPECMHRDLLEAKVREKVRGLRDTKSPEVLNQLLIDELFRYQSKPWKELARTHMVQAWDAVRCFVSLVLQHLAGEDLASLLMNTIIEPKLETIKQYSLGKIDELTADARRGYSLEPGESNWRTSRSQPLFSEAGFAMRAVEKSITKSDTPRDYFPAAEIVNRMQARYDIAISTFIHNVITFGIEDCLLDPMQGLFSKQVVTELEDRQIRQLAAEPSDVSEERDRLDEELDTLEAALKRLSVNASMTPVLPRPSILGNKERSPVPFHVPKSVRFQVGDLEVPTRFSSTPPWEAPTTPLVRERPNSASPSLQNAILFSPIALLGGSSSSPRHTSTRSPNWLLDSALSTDDRTDPSLPSPAASATSDTEQAITRASSPDPTPSSPTISYENSDTSSVETEEPQFDLSVIPSTEDENRWE